MPIHEDSNVFLIGYNSNYQRSALGRFLEAARLWAATEYGVSLVEHEDAGRLKNSKGGFVKHLKGRRRLGGKGRTRTDIH